MFNNENYCNETFINLNNHVYLFIINKFYPLY